MIESVLPAWSLAGKLPNFPAVHFALLKRKKRIRIRIKFSQVSVCVYVYVDAIEIGYWMNTRED